MRIPSDGTTSTRLKLEGEHGVAVAVAVVARLAQVSPSQSFHDGPGVE